MESILMFCSLIMTADICQCSNCCPPLLCLLSCLQCSISLSPKFPIMNFSHNVFEEVARSCTASWSADSVSFRFWGHTNNLQVADVASESTTTEAVLGLCCLGPGRHCQSSFDVLLPRTLYLFLFWSNSKDVSSLQSPDLLHTLTSLFQRNATSFS